MFFVQERAGLSMGEQCPNSDGREGGSAISDSADIVKSRTITKAFDAANI